MNNHGRKVVDSFRSFLLLSEIAGEEPLSQRKLSRRLGIAVGLVNSCLKNLAVRGFVSVRIIPRNRHAYLLTAEGLAEMNRLAYQHLSCFTRLYAVARRDYLDIFRRLEAAGVRELVFCGVDEMTEIAYLSLRETNLALAKVTDDRMSGVRFFDMAVEPLAASSEGGALPVVITSLKRRDFLREALHAVGIQPATIHAINC